MTCARSREELERFIISMGYEPVRHETGAVPYAKTQALDESAYTEVEHTPQERRV
jgi:hypothetical protein